MKGGAEFNWEVNRDDLYSSNEIVLYTVSEGFPSTLDELSEVYTNKQVNEFQSNFQYPRLL